MPDLKIPKLPPPHKSEKMFRRYEKLIGLVVDSYPTQVLFSPAPFSPITTISRFRDAISSVLEYKWTTSVDVSKLETLRPLFDVTHDHEKNLIMVGPRGRKPSAPTDFKVDVGTPRETILITDTDLALPYAFAVILNKRLLPFHIEFSHILDPKTITDITTRFDVSIDVNNGKTIMI